MVARGREQRESQLMRDNERRWRRHVQYVSHEKTTPSISARPNTEEELLENAKRKG